MERIEELFEVLKNCGELFVDELQNVSTDFDVGICTKATLTFSEHLYAEACNNFMWTTLSIHTFENIIFEPTVNLYTVEILYK